MAAYLSCMTVGGGVPMFTRRVGDLKAVRNIVEVILKSSEKATLYYIKQKY